MACSRDTVGGGGRRCDTRRVNWAVGRARPVPTTCARHTGSLRAGRSARPPAVGSSESAPVRRRGLEQTKPAKDSRCASDPPHRPDITSATATAGARPLARQVLAHRRDRRRARGRPTERCWHTVTPAGCARIRPVRDNSGGAAEPPVYWRCMRPDREANERTCRHPRRDITKGHHRLDGARWSNTSTEHNKRTARVRLGDGQRGIIRALLRYVRICKKTRRVRGRVARIAEKQDAANDGRTDQWRLYRGM